MSNEELIARLLEGSLNEAEHQEVESRMASSSQFAAEVSEYLSVEEMLLKNKETLPKAPAQLFTSVEDKVAMMMAGASTVAPAVPAITSSTSSFGLSKILAIITGLSVIATVAYFALKPPSEQPRQERVSGQDYQSPSLSAVQTVPPVSVRNSPTQEYRASAPSARQEVQQEKRTNERVPPESFAQNTETPKTSDDIMGGRAHDPEVESMLQAKIQLHDSLGRSGEKASQALVARQIGILYRDKEHNYEKGGQYLQESVQLLQELGIREEHAQSLGELGILEARRGNTDKAFMYLKECISILQSGKDAAIEKFKKELEKVQQKR